jgi:hypothetical protein
VGEPKRLRAVGYWREDLDLLPHPRWLVRRRWRAKDRGRIAGYLRGGLEFTSYFGYSWCRFRCGIDDALMGNGELTDGVWVWPEGLAHYVECHGVRLPDEFLATMESHGWTVPPGVRPPPRTALNLSFWLWWAFCHGGPWCWL